MEMKCIHCNEAMFTRDILGIEVELCPNCAGLWLDSGELKELTDYEIAAGRILTCYRCEKPLQTKLLRGVEIDICPDCASLWLDGGELMNLAGLDYKAGRILDCPRCQTQLQTKMLRGVEVDVCPKCVGVYLDRGELEKLSAIEPNAGTKTDIGKFLYDAYQARVELAIKNFRDGKCDKGKAADLAGVTQEIFNQLLEKEEMKDQLG
jgi:Zn-finger nucleic acid-binding protein